MTNQEMLDEISCSGDNEVAEKGIKFRRTVYLTEKAEIQLTYIHTQLKLSRNPSDRSEIICEALDELYKKMFDAKGSRKESLNSTPVQEM
jgi:hypothetical protein